jgi:hypothetical protein
MHAENNANCGRAESVEEAARRAAKEVLREFSAQTPDVVELRETIGATLAAVRQLETATMERITSLAASMQSLPTGSSSTGLSDHIYMKQTISSRCICNCISLNASSLQGSMSLE